MKVKYTILSELSKSQEELLNEQYTKAVAKIIASELSIHEISELIDKLIVNR